MTSYELPDPPKPGAWTTWLPKPIPFMAVANSETRLPRHLCPVCLPISFLWYRVCKAKSFPRVLCGQGGHVVLANEGVPGEDVIS